MYLTNAAIENSGALRWLDLSLGFDTEGKPKPLILVGGNGSGKTNFLALIADALFEAAANHFTDALPSQAGGGRSWFRLAGGRTITTGTSGSFSMLKFEDEGSSHFYTEKAGDIDPDAAALRLPIAFAGQARWPKTETLKQFQIHSDRARDIFNGGVYAYFPSSRSEAPYWLNREAIPETIFDISMTVSHRLKKQIFIERSIDQFKQWLMGVVSDTRTEISPSVEDGQVMWKFNANPAVAFSSSAVLELANRILQSVMNDTEVRFSWTGRKSKDKIAIIKNNNIHLGSLDALSAGQSILLGMFGTILRYADMSKSGSGISADNIEGICLIDEIDSHIHIELQKRVIPDLIKLFPKIQFIISTHSPIFVLGMEKEFGSESIQIVEMPNGIPVSAETYEEFDHAMDALSDSKKFRDKIVSAARNSAKPIVYVEGETDAPYIIMAAKVLCREDILESCDIEWIGATDSKGQGFHTGAPALKQTLTVLKANPMFSNRKVLLLYDNDSKTPDSDYENVAVRSVPLNHENTRATAGIENLLPEDCLTDEFYQKKEVKKPDGGSNINITLRKSELCAHISSLGEVYHFEKFNMVLDIISTWLKK